MKSKKMITILLMVLIITPSMSQTWKLRSGHRSYSRYNYADAVRYYSGVKEKSLEVERRMARSYEKLGDYSSAELVYERILKDPGRRFEDVWGYFMVLQSQGKYEEGQKQIPLLKKLAPEDSRVRMYRQSGEYYKRLQEDSPDFEIRSLSMNSMEQDFSPSYYRGGVVYASTRSKGSISGRLWPGNHKHYLNLYESGIGEDNDLTKGMYFDKRMNRKYHDGPVSFNSSGTLMAFTRNNYVSRSSDGTRNLQLFTSEYVDRGWTEPVSFPYNNPEYSVGQASLTPDGKTMYFISDMPGGVGGTDIYVIERRTDGTWGTPENLRSINTEGNEMFPVYHPDGLLFFSSNGFPGLGGLDVFVSTVADKNYGKPKNLGVPLNSTGDDFSLVLDKDQKFGYLSSNRPGGKGSDDIYGVKVLNPIRFKVIKGVTKDNQDNIITNAEVTLTLENNVIEKVYSDDMGKFEFVVNETALYKLTGNKFKYNPAYNTANTDVPENIIHADLIFNREIILRFTITIVDNVTGATIENAKITLKNNTTLEETVVYTSLLGDYKTTLSNNKLNDVLDFNVKVEKNGYLNKLVSFTQLLYIEGEYILILRLDPLDRQLVVGDDLAKKFQINPIYFDFDKYNIRPDAAVELDKIVQIMNAYPTMVIELTSHTDCRGSFTYNTILSDNRAQSSADYVRQRITNPDRIYGKGMGESKPVNNCNCEGTQTCNCSEEQHQMNRRTEFIIVKM